MDTKDKNVNVHIIHSMKGGCGKTACSLFMALRLAGESSSGNRASVILVDADFRGSALQWLLFESLTDKDTNSYSHGHANNYSQLLGQYDSNTLPGRGIHHQFVLPDNFDTSKTLNQYIKDKNLVMNQILLNSFSYEIATESLADEPASDSDASSDAASKGKAPTENHDKLCINSYIDFILSSSSSKDKALFRYGFNEGKYKMPTITSGIYTYRIAELIKQILNHGKASPHDLGQYRHIVIDMPPGYDEYSDLLLQELREAACQHTELKLHYYSVTTNDIGHMHLAIQNIEDIPANNSRFSSFDSVNVILNCLLPNDFSFSPKPTPDNMKDIARMLSFLSDKGILLKKGYEDAYHNFCRSSAIPDFACNISDAFTQVIADKGNLVEEKLKGGAI